MGTGSLAGSLSGISLKPITNEDVPTLVRLHVEAYKYDQWANLMLMGREDDAYYRIMVKSLEAWLADPKAELIQAVDDVTGESLGWTCWILKGEDEVKPEPAGPSSGSNPASSGWIELWEWSTEQRRDDVRRADQISGLWSSEAQRRCSQTRIITAPGATG